MVLKKLHEISKYSTIPSNYWEVNYIKPLNNEKKNVLQLGIICGKKEVEKRAGEEGNANEKKHAVEEEDADKKI